MISTLWLIVEGQMDFAVAKAIVHKHYPQLRMKELIPTGKPPNLSRLSAQLNDLIRQALDYYREGDCIAVLHDTDLLTRPHHRKDYENIRDVCRQYKDKVYLVKAVDELESWLLADRGLCQWLGIKPRNCDTLAQPSVE